MMEILWNFWMNEVKIVEECLFFDKLPLVLKTNTVFDG